MALSARTPLWRHMLHRAMPFLFRRCPDQNWHWRWDTICTCSCHGGGDVINLKTGQRYVWKPDGKSVLMLDVSGVSTEDQLRIVSAWQKALASRAAGLVQPKTPDP